MDALSSPFTWRHFASDGYLRRRVWVFTMKSAVLEHAPHMKRVAK